VYAIQVQSGTKELNDYSKHRDTTNCAVSGALNKAALSELLSNAPHLVPQTVGEINKKNVLFHPSPSKTVAL
jgi:hypothetical protein